MKADLIHKETNERKENSSKYRIYSQFQIGDKVWVRNFTRQRKFDPLFLECPFIITGIDVKSHSVEVAGDGKIFRRHLDDIKPYRIENTKSSGNTCINLPSGHHNEDSCQEWYKEYEDCEKLIKRPMLITEPSNNTSDTGHDSENINEETTSIREPHNNAQDETAENQAEETLRRSSRVSKPNPKYNGFVTYMLTINNKTGGIDLQPLCKIDE